ncbi:MAG: hypothetical protein IJU87_02740, partial [Lachnospiraceae bacterium]|nr:hypothetical protein [Lachnospiraceae bacterium]
MRRSRLALISIILALTIPVLFGCGDGGEAGKQEQPAEAAGEVSEEAAEEASKENTGMAVIDDSLIVGSSEEPSEDTGFGRITDAFPEEATSEEEPEILHFVDVFGEEYEVRIDPGIPKHGYDLNTFRHDGQMSSYSDDRYLSRIGIDVSHHQGNIDWQAVASQGIEFAILRIGYRGYGSEGKVCPDTRFREYIRGAKEAGLDVGVYFFAQAVNEEEAKCHPADYKLPLPSDCLGLNVGVDTVPLKVTGSF